MLVQEMLHQEMVDQELIQHLDLQQLQVVVAVLVILVVLLVYQEDQGVVLEVIQVVHLELVALELHVKEMMVDLYLHQKVLVEQAQEEVVQVALELIQFVLDHQNQVV